MPIFYGQIFQLLLHFEALFYLQNWAYPLVYPKSPWNDWNMKHVKFWNTCVKYWFVSERLKGSLDRGHAVSKQHWMTCSFGKIKSHHECTEKIQHLRHSNAAKSFAYSRCIKTFWFTQKRLEFGLPFRQIHSY